MKFEDVFTHNSTPPSSTPPPPLISTSKPPSKSSANSKIPLTNLFKKNTSNSGVIKWDISDSNDSNSKFSVPQSQSPSHLAQPQSTRETEVTNDDDDEEETVTDSNKDKKKIPSFRKSLSKAFSFSKK